MGTKRFILTENERKNILNLYNYKGILKNYTSNLINEGYDDTYKNYWKWCSVGLNPNAKNKNLNYSKIANNLLSGIEGAGTYKNTIRTWLNSVTYCGDLIEVEKKYTTISGGQSLFSSLKDELSEDSDWGKNVAEPLENIKTRTEKYLKTMKPETRRDLIEKECGSVVSATLDNGFSLVDQKRYSQLRADVDNYKTTTKWCEKLKRNLYFAKKKNVVVPPPPPVVTQQAGGGGMPIGVTDTNMKNDDNTYWNTLAMKLEDNGLQIKTGGLDFVDTPTFKVGKYTINRDTRPFIVYEIDVDNKIEANLAKMGNATPQRYSGEDLSSVRLLLLNDPKGRERVSLEEFLGTKQKPQEDNNRNQNRNQNRQRKKVSSSRYKLDTDGTYSLYSKSPKIAEVQRCLGLTGDGMMGPRTVNAVKAKLGKTSFTDADVATLCSGSQSNNNANNNSNNNANNNDQTPFTPEEY